MPATPITASTRYFISGLTKVNFASSIANKAAPTRGEINAATDLSPEVNSVEGWEVVGQDIETPDLASTFTSKVPGRTSADDSSITFYASQNSVDVRALLPRGTNGFILWFGEGDVASRKFDVFPVRVRSAPKPRDIEAAGMIRIEFSITSEPVENITVPA